MERWLRAEWVSRGFSPSFQATGLVTAKSPRELSVDELPAMVLAQRTYLSLGQTPAAPLGDWRHHEDTTVIDGELLLSQVAVASTSWWGLHRHHASVSPWPHAAPQLTIPANAPSRAWLKVEEASSHFGISISGRVLEVGCAPGGVTRALLDRGCEVIGVDPNTMDKDVASHPRFQQLHVSSARVDYHELPPIDWLVVDVSVPPGTALAGVRPLLLNRGDKLTGMLFTCKLKRWEMVAQELHSWRARIEHMTGLHTRAVHLHSNHQEVCVLAGPRGT
jgi:23S rRNA C2498 (ribose-2'-O)-methylase RlmM